MLTAEVISAVRIKLADGIEAVFVQHGEEWNSLTALRCVAPNALAGETIITAPDVTEGGRMSMLFANIFGRAGRRMVVMASPSIAAALTATATAPSGAVQNARQDDENREGRA